MSLINQMLKDLEKRRVNESNVNDGALQSVNRYVATRTGGPSGLLLGIIIALLVLLSAMLGYFLWDRHIASTKAESSALSATASTQKPATTSKKQLAADQR